ncbi:MAG TPA: 16S rRNA (guanine(966)-N(2))-methyltransferase RsmD [Acidobacteriota bacterium]|nr:16S rRNA (guanine(966)-N(2))-methyltransferase RsmD [Acidobacteriota bacterium]
MRVIAGRARGRRLRVPDQSGVRPTTDRARETLFSVLLPFLRDARVLDLFAGSGALGLEAVSRGARGATFVECHRKVATVLRANIAACDLESECEVVLSDYRAAVRRLSTTHPPFDLVFVDPPYGSGQGIECLAQLSAGQLVAEGGRVILEQGRHESAELPAQWELLRTLRIGKTVFLICSRVEPGPAAC